MKTTPQASSQSNPRVYSVKQAPASLASPDPLLAPKTILSEPAVSAPIVLPARQPLPTPVIDPNKPNPQVRTGRASGIHHGRSAARPRLTPGPPQVHPR